MKKIFKNPILTFIIGLIIAGGISVSAYSLFATNINYEPIWKKEDGTNITNVSEALDELYNKADSKRKYLYWNGNTYDEVTGGWDSSITTNTWGDGNNTTISKKNATFASNYMDLSIDNTFQYVVANTKNKIDCTNYNYITVWYKMSKEYMSLLRIESILNPLYYLSGQSRILQKRLLNNGDSYIISYPITCSEPGYVTFSTLRGVANDTVTDLKIYGVYLSKE